MEKFKFVTLNHPQASRRKENQTIIRAHAIRTSVSKARRLALETNDNFLSVEIDKLQHCPVKRLRKPPKPIIERPLRTPPIDHTDPFDTFSESYNRLQLLMTSSSAKQAGEPVFAVDPTTFHQSLGDVFSAALKDPTLYHALSLSLAFAANGGSLDVECLSHKGAALASLNERLADSARLLQRSTLTAVLLLIGVEYRIKNADPMAVDVHLRALHDIVKVFNEANVFFCDTIRRAIFWQDLLASFVVGTRRFFFYGDFPELAAIRDPFRANFYYLPNGFNDLRQFFSSEFLSVLEDINALCVLRDSSCMCGDSPVSELRVDNCQASIESRLVDLRNISRNSGQICPVFESCIYAAYACTYMLFTKTWEASFIPTFCSRQLLQTLQSSQLDPRWDGFPGLLLWLTYVGGSFAYETSVYQHYAALVSDLCNHHQQPMDSSWITAKDLLMTFIWSGRALEPYFRAFWESTRLQSTAS